MDEILLKTLKGYYCLFKGDPSRCSPFAIFATREEAQLMLEKQNGLTGPLTFEEWFNDFYPPSGKISWED